MMYPPLLAKFAHMPAAANDDGDMKALYEHIQTIDMWLPGPHVPSLPPPKPKPKLTIV